MVQITGGNLDLAFEELEIVADKLYEENGDIDIQVWEMLDKEFNKFNSISDVNWKDEYGWYRYGGTNAEGSELLEFIVNDKVMLGFKNEHSWYHSEDYLSELEEYETPELPEYYSFYHWFNEYYGLSATYNACYFIHSLSEINGLSKSEFLRKYRFNY